MRRARGRAPGMDRVRRPSCPHATSALPRAPSNFALPHIATGSARNTGRGRPKSADQFADRRQLELGDRLRADPAMRVETRRPVITGELAKRARVQNADL